MPVKWDRRCTGSGWPAVAAYEARRFDAATKRFPCPQCGRWVKSVGKGVNRAYAVHAKPAPQGI